MIEMINKLARIIIVQFIDIVDKASHRCSICWDKCALKIISRKHIDSLVIEILLKKCHNNNTLDVFIPTPLVTIEFTDIKQKNLNDERWIAYLQKKAAELLTKIAASQKDIFVVKCCLPKKPECIPVNKCDSVYHEEFFLCCEEKPKCHDKPYDEWGKPCKKCEHEYGDKHNINCHHKCNDKCENECQHKCDKKCLELDEKKYCELIEKKCLIWAEKECKTDSDEHKSCSCDDSIESHESSESPSNQNCAHHNSKCHEHEHEQSPKCHEHEHNSKCHDHKKKCHEHKHKCHNFIDTLEIQDLNSVELSKKNITRKCDCDDNIIDSYNSDHSCTDSDHKN
jgi:hypothetical protein